MTKELSANAKRLIQYLNFKSECMYHQERQGVKIDVSAAVALRDKLQALELEKTEELKGVMPKVPKYKTQRKPKEKYKKDGTYTVAWTKYESVRKQQRNLRAFLRLSM